MKAAIESSAPECAAPTTLDSLKCLVLDIAQQRSLNDLLWLIVRRSIRDRPTVVLARIWLIRPGDICETCRFKDQCPDQTQCLHLVASAGRSGGSDKTEWSNINGYFARFPIGVCKVGRIGKTGEQLVINELENNLEWIAKPEWAKQEGIRGFHGQPIIYKGEILGTLAVFDREPVTNEATVWFRMIADHVAVAIANARAFEEIEHLKGQLELENTFLKEEVLEAQNFGEIVGQSPPIANSGRANRAGGTHRCHSTYLRRVGNGQRTCRAGNSPPQSTAKIIHSCVSIVPRFQENSMKANFSAMSKAPSPER